MGQSCLGIPVYFRQKQERQSVTLLQPTTAVALSRFYSQSLLSVQDARAVHLFLEVPEVHIKTCVSTTTFSDVVMLSIDFELTGGPFGPGKPVGP